MKRKTLKKAAELIAGASTAFLTSIGENGYPRTVAMANIKTEGLKAVWFSTGTNSNKVRHYRANPKASVCYAIDGHNITLTGDIRVIDDMETKQRLWVDWFIEHFPGGVTDPDYCILKFETKWISLWLDDDFGEISISDAEARIQTLAESYCGLLCSECDFRERCNCGGCIATQGRPYHGECRLAVCCQSKGLTHCGECSDFPCALLNEFAYDQEHGDNGKRIEQLKKWKDCDLN
ncbi:MAG TPA: pyridoxamine 5'-phosphate oxidase family protein [Bacillota bacterium]